MRGTLKTPDKLRNLNTALWLPDNRQLEGYEIAGLARIYWPWKEIANVAAVSFCESEWWTGAHATVGEDSRGLLQLNVFAHPSYGRYNLGDPQINFYFAFQLWSEQGWRPWTCAHELGIV
jgi:hypothetical protein